MVYNASTKVIKKKHIRKYILIFLQNSGNMVVVRIAHIWVFVLGIYIVRVVITNGVLWE